MGHTEFDEKKRALFGDEVEWRYFMIINLISIRRALYELTFSIGFIALGVFLSRHWSNLSIGIAAAVCVSAAISYFWSREAENGLKRMAGDI